MLYTLLFGAFLGGILIGYLIYLFKRGTFEKLAQEILQKAENEAVVKRSSLEVELKQREFEQKSSLEKQEEATHQKLARKEEKLEKRLIETEQMKREFEKTKKEIQLKKKQLDELKSTYSDKLEKLAGLSPEEAKQILYTRFSNAVKKEQATFLYRCKQQVEQEAERHATHVITTAINRLSLQTTSEVAVVTVALPSPELKGRLIGREGRNIRVLEQVTGVNFLIDDTPNAVVISGFDPLRKEVAKQALTELLKDGRIHPTRIEEAVLKAEKQVHQTITTYGEEAAFKAGALSFHPEIIQLLGQLHFRYSYGQNVLSHSLEVCHIMGIMASELKLDSERAKRIGLLHDIGKAVSHEIEGSHALIGQQIALKYGESEEVANGIGCHHQEIDPETFEASLCSAADTLSGGRPGARLEALEQYLKRAAKLEKLSRQFEGVEKAYAINAGREVRVIVEPEAFDDQSTLLLAREIAKKIETELSYPGKIKVTVIREKRSIEYAT